MGPSERLCGERQHCAGLTVALARYGEPEKDHAVQIPAADGGYQDDRDTELLVAGFIRPVHARDRTVEVKRDMIILTGEGRAAGRVAGVVINRHDRQVTHILLSQRSQPPQYRLVPIALVVQVQGGQVLLDIFNQAVDSLPIWHGA
jgi:sporulation protein YlmC with PRC-barrel domain